MNKNGVHIDLSSGDDDSSMDDTSNGRHRRKTLAKAHSLTTTATNSHRPAANIFNRGYVEAEGENENDDEGFEGGDCKMWTTLNNNFQQVQSVLDRNRVLIQQVNDNHQSRIHDNLVKNVALIQELNGNISKVVSLYSDLSVNFSDIVHQRDATLQSKSNSGKSGS